MKSELNLFIVFEAVVRMGSVVKASELLNLSPPAISQALNQLREKHSDPLFIREKNGLTPTKYALDLYNEIKEPLNLLSSRLQRLDYKDHRGKKTDRTFKVATNADIEILFYDKLYNKLEAEGSHINLAINSFQAEQDSIKNALRLRKVDFIISTSAINEMSYENEVISVEKPIILARKDHPRIKEELSFKDLKKEKFISWKQQSSDQNIVVNTLLLENLNEKNIVYASSLGNMLYLASKTNLLALTSERMFERIKDIHKFNCFDVPFATQEVPLYLTWHKNNSKDEDFLWLKEQIKDSIKN